MTLNRASAALVLALVLSGCAEEEPGRTLASAVDPEAFRLVEPERQGGESVRSHPPAEVTESSTLHDLLLYAAEHSPQLEAAYQRWQAASQVEAQAGSLPDPRLTYRYYIERVETRTGAQRQSFGIEQQFPWFGVLGHRSRAASQSAQAAQRRFEATFLKVVHQVRSAWYDSYYLERAIEVTRLNLDLLKQFEGVIRTRYQVAQATQESMLRLQVELGKLEDRLRTMEDRRATIRARLNTALGREEAAPVPAPEAIADERVRASDAEIAAWARENNPELQALSHQVQAEEERIGEAEKSRYPNVMLGLTVIDTADQPGPGPHPSEDGQDPVIAGVSVNLPIWFDKYTAAIRQARARRRAVQSARAQYGLQLESDLRAALVALHSTARRIDLYRGSLLPRARQSMKATEAAFRGADVGFAELIDAQRALLDLQLTFERSLADHAQKMSELEMLVGRPVPAVGVVTSGEPHGAKNGEPGASGER